MLKIACPGCDKEYDVDDRLKGKQGKCKHCGTVIKIESSGQGSSINQKIIWTTLFLISVFFGSALYYDISSFEIFLVY